MWESSYDLGMTGQPPAPNAGAQPTTAERYRDRARSAATLLATAAGALTAGLVFSSIKTDLSATSQCSAYVSWTLFVISSCLYLWASLYSKAVGKGAASTFETSIVDTIRLITRWASVIGALAAAALLAVPLLNVLNPDPGVRVVVELGSDVSKPTDCPAIEKSFKATVVRADLKGASDVVPFKVRAADCGSLEQNASVVVHVDRTKVLIVELQEPLG